MRVRLQETIKRHPAPRDRRHASPHTHQMLPIPRRRPEIDVEDPGGQRIVARRQRIHFGIRHIAYRADTTIGRVHVLWEYVHPVIPNLRSALSQPVVEMRQATADIQDGLSPIQLPPRREQRKPLGLIGRTPTHRFRREPIPLLERTIPGAEPQPFPLGHRLPKSWWSNFRLPPLSW